MLTLINKVFLSSFKQTSHSPPWQSPLNTTEHDALIKVTQKHEPSQQSHFQRTYLLTFLSHRRQFLFGPIFQRKLFFLRTTNQLTRRFSSVEININQHQILDETHGKDQVYLVYLQSLYHPHHRPLSYINIYSLNKRLCRSI